MKDIRQNIVALAFLFFSALLWTVPVCAVEKEAEATGKLASSVSMVDTRVEKLRMFLEFHSSPLARDAQHFIEEADRLSLDWRLVPAIAGTESTFGKHVPTSSYNGWGWGIPTGASSGVVFASWEEGITRVSEGLKHTYVDRGARSVESIGRIYAASPHWATRVRFFMEKIESFSPTDPGQLQMDL